MFGIMCEKASMSLLNSVTIPLNGLIVSHYDNKPAFQINDHFTFRCTPEGVKAGDRLDSGGGQR